MKKRIIYCTFSVLIFFASCSEKKAEAPDLIENKIETALPFVAVELSDMTDFKTVTDNWFVAESVYANRSKEKMLSSTEGSGVLVNSPNDLAKENLFTTFEHGDIELELDVMIPKGSNSGIYFQSRYEVQLFDSWGVKEQQHGDMGGIYQRWDDSKEAGTEGYEGHAPKMNAAKAPGLWQHLKVIFHAPRFDTTGTKTQNAWFEEVWLNGVLVHENVEVTGPTRAAAFGDEKSLAPLMIQGDHGPVAFKNIQYKLYSDKVLAFKNLVLKEYENNDKLFPNLDSLKMLSETSVEAIDLTILANNNSQKIFKYSGTMDIPDSGDYLFDIKVNGGAALLIDTDTLISMNGDYNLDSLGLGKISLEKGDVPFALIYNKHTPWRRNFDIYAEGPGIQKYSLQKAVEKEKSQEMTHDFTIKVEDEPITQRSFWMHEGKKRTHCISVGMPQGIHYNYDLEAGSLLQVWGGDFMDASKMWLSRGEKQLGEPIGFIVSLHGDPEFASLENEDASWPDNSLETPQFKQQGYEFDSQGFPTILYQINGSAVTTRIVSSDSERALKRMITVEGANSLWYKIADGEHIEKLPDGIFIVHNESYYIDFDANSTLKPMIRGANGKDELLVQVPAGKQNINYTIIW
ncbi:3-keto-disaccharide hydrolase [Maribacter halichondriae]|uniref:3-keto-disaccharide hydrolase n=1 Tax=Maribacter halichondriae TaxID=2980554 RepID=UPI002358A53B|nr:DUF1080 domain-containing protein [Maribacter sp. Hal144]